MLRMGGCGRKGVDCVPGEGEFLTGCFRGGKCNENCKRKFCSVRILFTNVTLPYMSHIKIKLTVKPIRAIYTRKLRRVLHKTRLK